MDQEPREPIDSLLLPFQRFFRTSAAGGLSLFFCAALALAWANSPWAGTYRALFHLPLTVGLGPAVLSKPLLLWINDGLMAVFFFVVGLEIKREILVGELSSPRQALLPVAAALGGMAVPACVFLAFTHGAPEARGWGIPMATDIAFALGVLSLLGDRAPAGLRVFLTAVAIVDDIGAVAVIALFYTAQISWAALGAGFLLLAAMAGLNRLGVRRSLPYFLLGALVWLCFLKSGVHSTVAGVLAAMTIPSRERATASRFLERGRELMDEFGRSHHQGRAMLRDSRSFHLLQDLKAAAREADTPLQRLESRLHPWVSFAIMPLFALANAGVALDGGALTALGQPLSLGVMAGLVLGKQAGVGLAAWALMRAGLAGQPSGVSGRHLWGASCLAGIGFTMSIFIAGLAFGGNGSLEAAKVATLAGSLLAALIGFAVLRGAAPAEAGSGT